MHEVGITRSIVEIAVQHLRDSGRQRGISVSVAIGDLSGVVADAVEFCFDVVAEGTPLAGSQLIVERVAGRKCCLDCQADFPADNQTFSCPECGSCLLEVTAGDELKITEMEVE